MITVNNNNFIFLIILNIIYHFIGITALGYHYEAQSLNKASIHIITLNPKEYGIQLIKAHNSVFGRESLESMANRTNASIAINGGFFEIGNFNDGKPSRSLVINGQIYGIKTGKDPIFEIKGSNEVTIKDNNLTIEFLLANQPTLITHVNILPDPHEIVLFSHRYGSTTLTPYKGRKELVFDSKGKFILLYDHGNVTIPENSYVLSLPSDYELDRSKLASSKLNFIPKITNNLSYVSGCPLLIQNKEINPNILNQTSNFYTLAHARSAIGIKENGDIVIVLVEHKNGSDLSLITLNNLKSLLIKNKEDITHKYNKNINDLSLSQLYEIMNEYYKDDSNDLIGFTIIELANFMHQLGCVSALNLDGGGSSTLWIQGQIVNDAYGDDDEDKGQQVLRPLSDAIIFKKFN